MALLATVLLVGSALEVADLAVGPPDRAGRVEVGGRPGADTTGDLRRPAAGPKTIGGGLLVVVEADRLVASDAAVGTTRFDVALARLGLAPPPAGRQAAISLRAHPGGVVLAGGGTTVGVDRDGEPRWRLVSPRTATRVVEADDERAVLSGPLDRGIELLEVVEVADGTVRFTREIAALIGVEEQTALVRDPGPDTGVTAVSLYNGAVRWQSGSSSVGADGR